MDIGKRLIDHNIHAPTVYFPLIVPEALMIEPTETESRETLEAFAGSCSPIAEEDPEILHDAPHHHADQPPRRGRRRPRSRSCDGVRREEAKVQRRKVKIKGSSLSPLNFSRWGPR